MIQTDTDTAQTSIPIPIPGIFTNNIPGIGIGIGTIPERYQYRYESSAWYRYRYECSVCYWYRYQYGGIGGTLLVVVTLKCVCTAPTTQGTIVTPNCALSYDLNTLHLMDPRDFWQNSTTLFGATIKIGNFRRQPSHSLLT